MTLPKTTVDKTRVFYYNRNWQCVEEFVGATVQSRYFWGLRYIDELLVYRTGSTDYFVLQDANWNVIALSSSNGTILERYTYTAFGQRNVYDASFTPRSTTQFPTFTRSFTGQLLDPETGLLLYRNRHYHPDLGRFVQRDPIGYAAADVNLYRYVKNNPLGFIDFDGLQDDFYRPRPGYGSAILRPHRVDPMNGLFIPGRFEPKPDPCDGYKVSIGSKCDECNQEITDPYPEKAYRVCQKFRELYDYSRSVDCVAKCLADLENEMLTIKECNRRSAYRLYNHVACYERCKFVPTEGMPDGAAEVGWGMLLPGTFEYFADIAEYLIGQLEEIPHPLY